MEIEDLENRVAALENQIKTLISVLGGCLPNSLAGMRFALEEQLANPDLEPISRIALQDLLEHIEHLSSPDQH